MTTEELQLLESEMQNERKNKTPLWLLWVFTGGIGGHRFYLGDIGMGVAMLFCNWMTFGIWALVDAFFINRRLREKNEQKEIEIMQKINLMKQ